MSLEAFDQLYGEFAVAHGERLANLTVTRREGAPRQRAVGAGGKHRYDLRNPTRLVRIVAGLVNRRIREKPLKSYVLAMA